MIAATTTNLLEQDSGTERTCLETIHLIGLAQQPRLTHPTRINPK